VLRGIFGLKRNEVTGAWRKLHNEELHNLYSSPSIIRMIKSRRIKCAGHLVGYPEGKRQVGRLRRRWVDNIKMDLREIGWCGMDSINMAEDRDQRRAHVNTVMNIWIL
jgi:hypothetical protein